MKRIGFWTLMVVVIAGLACGFIFLQLAILANDYYPDRTDLVIKISDEQSINVDQPVKLRAQSVDGAFTLVGPKGTMPIEPTVEGEAWQTKVYTLDTYLPAGRWTLDGKETSFWLTSDQPVDMVVATKTTGQKAVTFVFWLVWALVALLVVLICWPAAQGYLSWNHRDAAVAEKRLLKKKAATDSTE